MFFIEFTTIQLVHIQKCTRHATTMIIKIIKFVTKIWYFKIKFTKASGVNVTKVIFIVIIAKIL